MYVYCMACDRHTLHVGVDYSIEGYFVDVTYNKSASSPNAECSPAAQEAERRRLLEVGAHALEYGSWCAGWNRGAGAGHGATHL